MAKSRAPEHLEIRRGDAGDAAALTAFARLTFVETYERLNSPSDTNLHLDEFYYEGRQREELINPNMCTLLALVHSELVGFAQLEKGVVPQCIEAEGAVGLKRYYVKSNWHGKGIAAPLLSAAVGAARLMNATHLWLTVWDQNLRAIAFYHKVGFKQVGSCTFVVGSDPQNDSVMALDLQSCAA